LSTKTQYTSFVKRHFHTFDALRFFACFKVFLHHLPIIAFPWLVMLKTGGGIGVQFFFVLSGFLITYIILEEQKQTGNLNLKHFFLRRVLRIWPLFYLAIAIAFFTPFILSQVHLNSSTAGYAPDWLWSVLFLENYKMITTHSIPNISPLGVMWSLCVEEHFYIIWGLLLYTLPLKKVKWLIGLCIIVSPIFRFVYINHNLATIDILTNIDLFAYGALPAYLIITRGRELESLIQKISIVWKRMFVVGLLAIVVGLSQPHPEMWDVMTTSIAGLLFSILIMLTLPSITNFSIGDTNVLNKLGLYTYGFYIYHTLVINLLLRVFEKYGLGIQDDVGAIVFTLIAFVLSIVVSMLSYHLFEKQFLKLKAYFR